jgi:hypothetical protein
MTLVTANSLIAGIGALVLTGVLARMDVNTCNGIRVSVVLMFAGLVSDVLSIFFAGWGPWAMTLLYAGGALFFVFDQRYGFRSQWKYKRSPPVIDLTGVIIGRTRK